MELPWLYCCCFFVNNGSLTLDWRPPTTGHQWIPLAKASSAELWCFLWSAPKQTAEQTIETWFEQPSRTLWRHRNDVYSVAEKRVQIGNFNEYLHLRYHIIFPTDNQWIFNPWCADIRLPSCCLIMINRNSFVRFRYSTMIYYMGVLDLQLTVLVVFGAAVLPLASCMLFHFLEI